MIGRVLIGLGGAIAAIALLAVWLLRAPLPPAPQAQADTFELEIDGRVRRYRAVFPHRPPARPHVLLVLHPSQSSGAQMRRTVGGAIERIAARERMVVIYPDGIDGHYNDCRRVASYAARLLDIDDVGFVRAIVARLRDEQGIDVDGVYALGLSNGGHMAFRLALEAPDLVDGIAAFAASLPTADNLACRPAGPLPRTIVLVNGTNDPINPYAGGEVTLFGFGSRGTVLSAEASAAWFARGMTAVAPTAVADGVVLRDWSDGHAQVRLLTIVGGGHALPQRDYRYPRILGRTLRSDAVLASVIEVLTRR